MPSGPTRIIYNTRERLISTDPNRGQAFAAQAQQEAWRARHNDLRANWRFNPGLSAQAQIIGAPLYGEVYSGLFVRPDVASYLTIDPGLAMVVDTGAPAADDSPYVFVRDPGLSTPGVLTFTANVTPATLRWDVIECQPVDTLLESSSRDIYNPATGLFAPVAVDKVRCARMTYRIRLGVPGTGFPGAAVGWLPLAVAAVRNGATGFNQVDFYDVRPLVEERVLPQPIGAAGNEGLSLLGRAHYQSFQGLIYGYAESEFGGYLAGGALRTSVPAAALADFGVVGTATGGDNPRLDVANAANVGPYTLGNEDMVYVVAMFPQPPLGQGFIPRWARYCQAPDPTLGRRVPKGPRGILAYTTTQPGANNLFAPLAFPANMQMGVNGIGTSVAMLSSFGGAALGNSVQVDQLYQHIPAAGGTPWDVSASSLAADLAVWNLVAGTHFPPGAKSLLVSFSLVCTSASSFPALQVRSTSTGGFSYAAPLVATRFPPLVAPSAVATITTTIKLPRPPFDTSLAPSPYPSSQDPNWDVRVVPQDNSNPVTFGSATMYIHGWEF